MAIVNKHSIFIIDFMKHTIKEKLKWCDCNRVQLKQWLLVLEAIFAQTLSRSQKTKQTIAKQWWYRVLRTLAFHQYGPGSFLQTPLCLTVCSTRAMSLFLYEFSGFLRFTKRTISEFSGSVFIIITHYLHNISTYLISNSIWKQTESLLWGCAISLCFSHFSFLFYISVFGNRTTFLPCLKP